jgi:transcriptional regulator with XRE-family HTH domain
MENQSGKMEKPPLPGVTVDGTKVRTIREGKRLTQLYVASVVGVTTDTISRWENNRYPTMKRDNAEKLAGALEVELAEIVQETESTAPAEEPLAPVRKKSRRAVMLVLPVLVLAVTVGGWFVSRLTAPLAAVRMLSRFCAPGEIIPVQIKVSRGGSDQEGIIIKERLPAGWRLVASLPPAAAGRDAAGEVKWLIPGGSDQFTLSYTVQVGPAAPLASKAAFAGSVVARAGGLAHTETIGGDLTVKVAGMHWADSNGDGRIDDNEIMPAYYLTEELKGLGLDWKTIEVIWSGKGYLWDREKQGFAVVR